MIPKQGGENEDGEDTTVGEFNNADQLFASRGNAYSRLANPTAESAMLYRKAKGKDSIIRISSPQILATFNRNKRILQLMRRVEPSSPFEQSTLALVQQYLALGLPNHRRLAAVVGAAMHLVHRLNHSSLLLDSILAALKLRLTEVARCLRSFKLHGFCQKAYSLALFPIFQNLVNRWFPMGTNTAQPKAKVADSDEEDFAMRPAQNLVDGDMFAPQSQPAARENVRDELLRIGGIVMELPETEFVRQGKKPQSVVAGVFVSLVDYFGLPICPREVAEELSISYATILDSKKMIQQLVLEHARKQAELATEDFRLALGQLAARALQSRN